MIGIATIPEWRRAGDSIDYDKLPERVSQLGLDMDRSGWPIYSLPFQTSR